MNADRPELVVKNLNVYFGQAGEPVHALRDVSFTAGTGKLGIVGESGSGKSTLGRAVLRLLPDIARIEADQMRFGETDLLSASEKAMLSVRGHRIGMILQDPKYSLNPTMRVGEQILEAVRLHSRVTHREGREQVLDLLDKVRIRMPRRVYDLYPHEISGGMGQRVMIATALAGRPDLIIADEPTSALDVTVRRQLLELMDAMILDRGISLILITHDLDLAGSYCDRVMIMYAGRIVETVAASELDAVRHPYSQGLLASAPRLDRVMRRLPVMARAAAWTAPGEAGR